jgi:hypothetical protein
LLAEANIKIEMEDLAAEMQIDLNTGLSYGGVSPYSCLFGTHPRPVFSDESEEITASSDSEPFYEHQQVRLRCTSAFQQALIQYRVQRASTARPRKEMQSSYSVGDVVDVYRRPKQKDLTGWRGPATVLALVGEGLVTVRWQSTVYDAPIHHLRPHINISSTRALPPVLKPAIEASPVDPFKSLMEKWDKEEKEIDEKQASITGFCDRAHSEWETFYQEEIADQMRHHQAHFDTLASIVSAMPSGTVQNHSVETRRGELFTSRDAQRDLRAIFAVGHNFAKVLGITNYSGVLLSHGRRHLPVLPGIHQVIVVYWTNDPAASRQFTLEGTSNVDFIRQGISVAELKDLKCICILESPPEQQNILQRLLSAVPEELNVHPNDQHKEEGRVRFELEPDLPRLLDDDAETKIASSVDWDVNLSASETFAMQLRGITPSEHRDEVNASTRHVNSLRRHFAVFDQPNSFEACVAATSSRDNHPSQCISDCVFYFDADTLEEVFFPLDKDCRPLNAAELISESKEILESQLKELKSWLANNTGKPVLKKTYEESTGLRGLPSRWVIEFKRKEGRRIVKCRLCLKGFAEQNQHELNCASPTATRLGHRIVAQTSASRKWPLESLDISTAFLQGFRFDDLPKGVTRQPCAFSPPSGTFALLAKLDPVWADAAAHPELYLFQLDKAAYGLKDAPLMWWIAINTYLVDLGYKNTSHDPCCYKLVDQQKLVLLLSLHVDDTLCTGSTAALNKLHSQLEIKYGIVKRELNRFRHFGVDTFKCLSSHHVWLDQRDYLSQLKPIEVVKLRGSGRTQDSPANPEEVTLFRSLVSAIAWLGVTFPPALAGASLYQSYLPIPTLGQIAHLNNLLAQFTHMYVPLVLRSDIDDPVLVIVSDSSLANNSKYSQGGYFILLANRSHSGLCGICSVLSYKSSKSKRVASSTLHAETLALVAGIEEASLVQTFLLEIDQPHLSTLELINAEPSSLVPMIGTTDCHDLLDTLVKNTSPVLSNKAMQLYTTVLREFRETNRVSQWTWTDTRDNLANGLTKLESDGTLPIADICKALECGAWEPMHPFRWGLQLCDPVAETFSALPAPPSITKQK